MALSRSNNRPHALAARTRLTSDSSKRFTTSANSPPSIDRYELAPPHLLTKSRANALVYPTIGHPELGASIGSAATRASCDKNRKSAAPYAIISS